MGAPDREIGTDLDILLIGLLIVAFAGFVAVGWALWQS